MVNLSWPYIYIKKKEQPSQLPTCLINQPVAGTNEDHPALRVSVLQGCSQHETAQEEKDYRIDIAGSCFLKIH